MKKYNFMGLKMSQNVKKHKNSSVVRNDEKSI